ncbi:MAG: C4-dicarboxylate ABC transporter, partial [Oceanospirillum sp.]|nr:C4-dicarboxylate ABC transporter [Oceanospirillum sp.]
STIFELLINKDVWNQMSEGQQAAMDQVCKASMTDSFAEGEAKQFAVMKENVEKNNVKIMKWNDTMLDAFEAAWTEVAQEEASNDAFFKKVWDDLSEFREGYKLWGSNGYLPRQQ